MSTDVDTSASPGSTGRAARAATVELVRQLVRELRAGLKGRTHPAPLVGHTAPDARAATKASGVAQSTRMVARVRGGQ